jgi:hypothetical protein
MTDDALLGRQVTLVLTETPSNVLRIVSATAKVPIGIEAIPDSKRTVALVVFAASSVNVPT